jgi:hypothetical protein
MRHILMAAAMLVSALVITSAMAGVLEARSVPTSVPDTFSNNR